MLIDMHGAVVNGTVRRLNVDKDGDSGTGNDYVIDCRCRRSADCASVDSFQSESKRPASPISATATYWHGVINNGGNKTAASRRRCESCNSDVSVTSLPESLTSDNDVMDSPPCKELVRWTPTSTGNSFAGAKQAEDDTEPSSDISAKSAITSGHSSWLRDVIVDSALRPPAPTAVGFSIADILRPDFGVTPRPSEVGCRQKKEAAAAVRRCPPYPSSVSLLPSTVRRSLVHPYTAAAAFCAAAVAAAAAGVQGTAACGPTDSVHRQELLRQQVTNTSGVRRMTSSRDITYHVINNNNNNNNNTKLRSRYVCDNKDGGADDVRQKAPAARRTRVQQASPSNLRTTTSATTLNPTITRPDQSDLASPVSQTSSTASTNRPAREAVVDGKKQGDDGSSPALVPLPWPAWVYCTRYSDRPSSGRQSKSCTPMHIQHTHIAALYGQNC